MTWSYNSMTSWLLTYVERSCFSNSRFVRMARSLSRIGCSFGSSGMRTAGESVMPTANVRSLLAGWGLLCNGVGGIRALSGRCREMQVLEADRLGTRQYGSGGGGSDVDSRGRSRETHLPRLAIWPEPPTKAAPKTYREPTSRLGTSPSRHPTPSSSCRNVYRRTCILLRGPHPCG